MKKNRSFVFVCLISFSFLLFSVKRAEAISMGDAALTVAVTSGAGAILGASTLPFYGEPDKHKKNIFYGASFGAIIGVLIAAYAGFQESADAEMAARNYRFIAPDTSSVLVSKSTSVISVNESLAFIPATLFRF